MLNSDITISYENLKMHIKGHYPRVGHLKEQIDFYLDGDYVITYNLPDRAIGSALTANVLREVLCYLRKNILTEMNDPNINVLITTLKKYCAHLHTKDGNVHCSIQLGGYLKLLKHKYTKYNLVKFDVDENNTPYIALYDPKIMLSTVYLYFIIERPGYYTVRFFANIQRHNKKYKIKFYRNYPIEKFSYLVNQIKDWLVELEETYRGDNYTVQAIKNSIMDKLQHKEVPLTQFLDRINKGYNL